MTASCPSFPTRQIPSPGFRHGARLETACGRRACGISASPRAWTRTDPDPFDDSRRAMELGRGRDSPGRPRTCDLEAANIATPLLPSLRLAGPPRFRLAALDAAAIAIALLVAWRVPLGRWRPPRFPVSLEGELSPDGSPGLRQDLAPASAGPERRSCSAPSDDGVPTDRSIRLSAPPPRATGLPNPLFPLVSGPGPGRGISSAGQVVCTTIAYYTDFRVSAIARTRLILGLSLSVSTCRPRCRRMTRFPQSRHVGYSSRRRRSLQS